MKSRMGEKPAIMDNIKLGKQTVLSLNIGRLPLAAIGIAEGYNVFYFLKSAHCVFIIAVGNDLSCHGAELAEGFFDVIESTEIVKVVCVHVQHHCDIGIKL